MKLAETYSVSDILTPLFEYLPLQGDNTPTKEQVLSYTRKPVARQYNRKSTAKDNSASDISANKRKKSNPETVAPVNTDRKVAAVDDSKQYTDYFANFYNSYPPVDSMQYNMAYHHQPIYTQPVEPLLARHRASLVAMFMNDDTSIVPEILMPHFNNQGFNIDLELDDHGHTALHWAAALGRISLLELLIQRGANPHLLNMNGETALMRSVMVPNNCERLSFPRLLEILKDQLLAIDKKERTVLHHACSSGSMKGSAQSCRYYMECILDFIGKYGKTTTNDINFHEITHVDTKQQRIQLSLMIDKVDLFGDTPINIAARIGNRFLVDELLLAGADPSIPNKVGLRPMDFGYDSAYLAQCAAPSQVHSANLIIVSSV